MSHFNFVLLFKDLMPFNFFQISQIILAYQLKKRVSVSHVIDPLFSCILVYNFLKEKRGTLVRIKTIQSALFDEPSFFWCFYL